jgi:mono/diheme cytochrome c family protein
MNKGLAFLLLLLALSLLAGCGPQPLPFAPTPIPTLAAATLPAIVPTQPAAAGEGVPTAVVEGEMADGAALVAAGGQVFDQNCLLCHNLTAEAKVGPGLAGIFAQDRLPNGTPVNDENLKAWIRAGSGAMPGIALPDDQLEALLAFLKEATN